MSEPPVRARIGLVLWVFAGLGLLATCAEPVEQDYTQRFPVGTQPETVSVPAHFIGNADPFAGSGAESFNIFVEGYLDRGHGPITIASRRPTVRGNSPTLARMEELRRRLVAAGVPASLIRPQLYTEGPPDTVTLSYERYTAVLPTCGDWSTRMDYNPLNTDYAGFGCDQQHNLGAMVADPADLATMRQPAPSSTANVERVIRDYNGVGIGLSGAPVSTETNKNALQGAGDLNAASGSTVGNGGSSTR
jgi:pilus biogenesis lipoprotein CpaD